jgi:hypothetical protein
LLGAIVIGGAIGLTRGVPALSDWTAERRASAEELRRELARLEQGIAGQRDRKALLSSRAAALAELDRGLLRGATPASAAASLAQVVGTAADSSNVHVRSTQVRLDSATAEQHYSDVTVRVDATGDVRGLTQLLARLERGPTLLVVRSLSVSQPEPLAEMEALRIELEVAGLMRASRQVDAHPRPSSLSAGTSP